MFRALVARRVGSFEASFISVLVELSGFGSSPEPTMDDPSHVPVLLTVSDKVLLVRVTVAAKCIPASLPKAVAAARAFPEAIALVREADAACSKHAMAPSPTPQRRTQGEPAVKTLSHQVWISTDSRAPSPVYSPSDVPHPERS